MLRSFAFERAFISVTPSSKVPLAFAYRTVWIEQVNKMIEQRVLVFNVERQYAVTKPRHVVKIIFPHFFAAVSIPHEQSDITQGLTRIADSWDIAALDNAAQHETQSGSAFFSLKVVLREVAAIGCASVAFGQCAQTAKPSRDG
jgi:hypothetical protein